MISGGLRLGARGVRLQRRARPAEDVGKSLTTVLVGGAVGAVQWSVQATAVGFLVGAVVAGASSLITRPTDPLRYLSQVEKAGATLVTAGAMRW
jgi:microcompartment protein CcmL/EutN